MFTALLILVLVFLVVGLIGVVCQIFGGGFFAIFHLMNNSVGLILELIGQVFVAILEGLNN